MMGGRDNEWSEIQNTSWNRTAYISTIEVFSEKVVLCSVRTAPQAEIVA